MTPEYTDPLFSLQDAVVILLGGMGGSVIGLGLAAICEWFVNTWRAK